MGAAFHVQALVRDAQPLHRTACNQVFSYDLVGIFGLNAAVPDGVGIDDDRGPVLALVETPGFIDAHLATEPGLAR